ncbi:MAG: zf-HC2 domain-containing protein [Fimbriimonadaceae bacterium]|nr:zf-HC2 domain-containing protein [Fimbriimonadaceae bacterium]QYK56946.1 MAG: zf-HC2 domain-containing protein [Fimbriimonadaceae bacterium]
MNQRRTTDPEPKILCQDVLDLLYLYACDELDPEEKDEVEKHVAVCESCRKAAAEHRVMQRSLPSGFASRKLFYYSSNN